MPGTVGTYQMDESEAFVIGQCYRCLFQVGIEGLIVGRKEFVITDVIGLLQCADKVLKVTAKEFDLLEYFVKHKGMILSRDKILDSVWGFDYIGGYRSVDTLVKKLRAKLTKEYPYIKTVYGVGYCFDV